jgi:hypothetical protein
MLGNAAIMTESTNLYESGNASASGSNWIDTGALSVRGGLGALQPYGAIVFPLDHDSHQVFDTAILLGLEGQIH